MDRVLLENLELFIVEMTQTDIHYIYFEINLLMLYDKYGTSEQFLSYVYVVFYCTLMVER